MASILGALTFGVAAIIYILLALGYPLGEYAMGGKYKIMPNHLRIACAISVLIQVFGIMIILQTGGFIPLLFPIGITRRICYFFAIYLSLNTIMNTLSKSKKEKHIITPLSIVSAICFWVVALNT